ncbi:hypothetical protein EON82_05730 [bacterium]|nr:MAG: hypothetical protein EON82_05730 [bacterium]
MRDAPQIDVLIAPGEIDELMTRLAEQTFQGVPHYQARTLEGLAAETGIPVLRLQAELARMRGRPRVSVPPLAIAGVALVGAYGYWVLNRRQPEPQPTVQQTQPAPPSDEPDQEGLTSLDSVTYGPDYGTDKVDPNFQPVHALPEGLSFTASTGGVLWGTGDHRAAVIQQTFSNKEKAALEETVVELMKHVRTEAARRRLPTTKEFDRNHLLGFPVILSSESYYGRAQTSVSIPPPSEKDNDAFDNRARAAAKQLVEQLIQNIRQRREFDRMQGP